jgi:hypothetical protein
LTAVCAFRARVDAHFAGGNSVAEEVGLRRHLLEGCPDCRRRYTRQAMLARLLPDRRSAEDRMAIALGLSGRSKPRRRGGPFLLLAALAATAVLVGGRPQPPVQPGTEALAGSRRMCQRLVRKASTLDTNPSVSSQNGRCPLFSNTASSEPGTARWMPQATGGARLKS